jgi:hypothetical protein
MSILSSPPWQGATRVIDDWEYIHDSAFDPLSPFLDKLSDTSSLSTQSHHVQMLNMASCALQHSISSAPATVDGKPFSSQIAPSRAQWENHRARIVRLYENEEKTLKEVMQIMREQHDFKATQKMYKSKLKLWKARKYVTKRERDIANQVIQMKKRRGEAHGRVIIRGKDRLDALLRHSGQSRVRACRRQMPESIDYSQDIVINEHVPSQNPIISPPLYPPGLEKSIEALCKFMPYLAWKMPPEGLSFELFYAMKQACIYCDKKSFAKARTSLVVAANWFKANIASRPSLALMSLLRSQTFTGYDGFYSTRLFKKIYANILRLTNVYYGSQHFFTKLVFHILLMSREPTRMQLMFQNVATETIAVLHKHNSSEKYRWQTFLAVKIQKIGNKAKARALLVDAVSSFDKYDVYSDRYKWQCMLNLARHYIADASDMDEEAERILEYLLEAATDPLTRKVNPWHASYVYRALGQLAEKRGAIDAAIDFYYLRVQGAVEVHGNNGVMTLHSLKSLPELLRVRGREGEAVMLEKKIRLKDELGYVDND